MNAILKLCLLVIVGLFIVVFLVNNPSIFVKDSPVERPNNLVDIYDNNIVFNRYCFEGLKYVIVYRDSDIVGVTTQLDVYNGKPVTCRE